MDTSKIEHKFLKENQLVGLGFPNQGFVFLRCISVESIEYEYDESPAAIAADTYEDATRLSMATYNKDNVLRVTDCDHIYQVFMGWKPGAVRQYLYYPYEAGRRNLDIKTIYNKAPFGYIDGYQSEYDRPAPDTELFIPYDIDVGFAWWNPLSESVSVEQHLLIRRLKIDVLRDVDLIDRILKGTQPCRIATLGGIENSMGFDAKSTYDVDFIKLGSTKDEIAAAVA